MDALGGEYAYHELNITQYIYQHTTWYPIMKMFYVPVDKRTYKIKIFLKLLDQKTLDHSIHLLEGSKYHLWNSPHNTCQTD